MKGHPMTTTAAPALAATMRDGYKDYGFGEAAVRALNGVNVDIARSEFTAIMGPSGSGKSTLLHTLAGLDRLTAGSSTIAETTITSLSEAQITEVRRKYIGFVFQSFNLIPSLSAKENITLPLDISGTDVDKAWFEEIIGILGLGDRRPTCRPSCPVASSSASPSHGRWCRVQRSSSRTSPPATSTRGPDPSC
jgi:putative ABC transport system ATP-binding protein